MIGLLLILVVSLMLAYIIKRDIEEVLPPFVMTLMLGIYGTGILKKSHHAFFLSMCAFAVIAVCFVVVLIKRRPSSGKILQNVPAVLKAHSGFLIFLIACGVMVYCYSTHFVNVWDDFHYNATFPKDCWYYGTMTSGNTSATYYKSYLPLQQLFFYWGFQSIGTFSEPMMFYYKMILIYILLLPFFKKISETKLWVKITVTIFTLIMPFLFMFEVIESLSMDTVMASLFAYAVVNILTEKNRDLWCFYRICVATACLTLMKSIALMFTGITLGIWLFDSVVRLKADKSEEKGAKLEFICMIASTVIAAAAYLSWKIFCDRNGNSVYLSDKLSGNLTSGVGFSLPSYGKQTIINILKSIFGMSTNLGSLGLSLGAATLFGAVLIGIIVFSKRADWCDFWTFLILLCGMAVYVAFLCYTYCFLFEPWEAESLSSLDRYFGTYSYVIIYVTMYRYLCFVKDSGSTYCKTEIVLVAAVVILIVTLPFKNMISGLNPSKYLADRNEYATIKSEVQEEVADLLDLNLPKCIVMVVNDSENDMYSRSLDYELIPHISRPVNVCAYESMSEKQQAIDNKIAEENPDYIYFSLHERGTEDVSVYYLPDKYHPIEGVEGLYGR